jgi:TolB protein
MSEFELLVEDALDASVPLRLDRLPAWDDVLARAAVGGATKAAPGISRIWRSRSRRLVLALAVVVLAVIVVGSALAALGAGPFGTVTSWLGYSSGSRATAEVVIARPNGSTERLSGSWLSWSPDGSRLLVESDGGIDVVGADGSPGIRIPALHFPSSAQWSPDGRRIAYDNGRSLYLVDADGGGKPRLLARGVNSPTGTWSWSPAGDRIVYPGVDARGGTGIFIVNTSGAPRSRRIQIRPRPSAAHAAYLYRLPTYGTASWSPDGSRIAFQWDDGRGRCCVNSWIYVMKADGSGATRIHRGNIRAWSPNGRKLAFAEGIIDDFSLSIVNADGSGLRRLPCRHHCGRPTWFPNSTRLAYATRDGQQIVTVRADGTNRRIVAQPGGRARGFALSPDGSTIAYVAGRFHDPSSSLYVIDADGSNRRLIARSSATRYANPTWRPLNG